MRISEDLYFPGISRLVVISQLEVILKEMYNFTFGIYFFFYLFSVTTCIECYIAVLKHAISTIKQPIFDIYSRPGYTVYTPAIIIFKIINKKAHPLHICLRIII